MKYLPAFIICLLLVPCLSAAENGLFVREATKQIVLTGYTRSIKSQVVSSEISGKVLKVNLDIGDAAGSKPFIEIDPTFIDFQIQSTSHSLTSLEITIKKARSRVSYLEKESSRIEGLLIEDLATKSRSDAVSQDLEQAILELQSAEEEQSVLKLKLAELIERRNRHNISVPQGWIVTKRDVEVNENVQPGAPLGRVADYRELVVPLYVSSDELLSIQSLPRTFNAKLEGATVMASINWINPEFNEKTRKLHIELILINYSGPKRGGLKLTLPLNVYTDGLYIPKAAVSTRYENPVVTLKHTEQVIQLLILEDAGSYLLAAEDERLSPGMELKPAQSAQQSREK
jgi:hypothetical protein